MKYSFVLMLTSQFTHCHTVQMLPQLVLLLLLLITMMMMTMLLSALTFVPTTYIEPGKYDNISALAMVAATEVGETAAVEAAAGAGAAAAAAAT